MKKQAKLNTYSAVTVNALVDHRGWEILGHFVDKVR